MALSPGMQVTRGRGRGAPLGPAWPDRLLGLVACCSLGLALVGASWVGLSVVSWWSGSLVSGRPEMTATVPELGPLLLAEDVCAAAASDSALCASVRAGDLGEDRLARPLSLHDPFVRRLANPLRSPQPGSRLHFVHMPKAAGSEFTVTMRDIFRCDPPGSCCIAPGWPKGTCRRSRECPAVIGCTGHDPHMEWLDNSTVPSVTMLREPLARLVSAHSYRGHSDRDRDPRMDRFDDFALQTIRFRDVMTKMLLGRAETADPPPPQVASTTAAATAALGTSVAFFDDPASVAEALRRLEQFDVVGVAELFGCSRLQLFAIYAGPAKALRLAHHEGPVAPGGASAPDEPDQQPGDPPSSWLAKVAQGRHVGGMDVNGAAHVSSAGGLLPRSGSLRNAARRNAAPEYLQRRLEVFANGTLVAAVRSRHLADLLVYRRALALVCERMERLIDLASVEMRGAATLVPDAVCSELQDVQRARVAPCERSFRRLCPDL